MPNAPDHVLSARHRVMLMSISISQVTALHNSLQLAVNTRAARLVILLSILWWRGKDLLENTFDAAWQFFSWLSRQ